MELLLLPLDLEAAELVAAGGTSPFARASNAGEIATVVREVATALAELYRRTGAKPPWIGYLGQDGEHGPLVGTGGFKAAPVGQTVEIAYFTFPGWEGAGWGRRIAAALVAIAWREPSIAEVIAHTLPAENASARILRRLGFRLVGPVEDSEDGLVWRWSLLRPDIERGV